MSKPTYIDFINHFWLVHIENKIAPNTTKLYFKLLDLNNQLVWKANFSRANSCLCSELPCAESTLCESRKQLVELGLITYKTRGNGRAGVYSIFTDSIEKYFDNRRSFRGVSGALNKEDKNRIYKPQMATYSKNNNYDEEF